MLESLNDEVCRTFLSWCRYITHEGDPTHLFYARNAKINEIKRKRESNRKKFDSDSSSSEGLDLQDVFKGHNVLWLNKQAETTMWQLVAKVAQDVYDRYPTTLEEDLELLRKDESASTDEKLTYN